MLATDNVHRRAIAAFSEIAGDLVRDRPLEDTLHRLAERLCELLEIGRCSIFLRDGDGELFKGAIGHERAVDADIQRLVSGTEADAFSREIADTGQPVLIADTRTDPRVIRHRMLEWNVRTMLGVPMTVEGRVLGILYLDNAHDPYAFSSERQQLAATFADLAAVALAQALRLDELRRNVRLVEAKNRLLRQAAAVEEQLTRLAIGGADLDQIACTIARLCGKPVAIHDVALEQLTSFTPDGGRWSPLLLSEEASDIPALHSVLAGLAEQPVTLVPALIDHGLRHRLLVAPLAGGERPIGYLAIEERPGPFGPIDRMIARQAAALIALERVSAQRTADAEYNASVARQIVTGLGRPDATGDALGPAQLLLTGDPRLLGRFVQETLGALANGRRATERSLLETLHAFFDCAQSIRRTAETLGVHENTVRYRLQRVEQLTERRLDRAEDRLSLQLAAMVTHLRA